MNRLGSILLWSAIAAAFIGPGTVGAAVNAGSQFGTALLWTMVFAGIATFTLQEFAGRLSIASGRDLASALRQRYRRGLPRILVIGLVAGAILLGCAAYEAGNILGGVAGAMLALNLPRAVLTLAMGGAAVILLMVGSPQRVAQAMALFVALMGFGFLVVAVMLALAPGGLPGGGYADPAFWRNEDALLAVLALVGTTVVPYNLFLGAALARGQSMSDMRVGLAVSVGVGVCITAAIIVVGTALTGPFSFEALGAALAGRLGDWARIGLGVGLLAAGLSSATTAPLAAALTAQGLFGSDEPSRWAATGWRFRAVWGGVIAIGVALGLAEIKPAPAIIAAQAFNGALLPLVALFLIGAMNDRELLGGKVNGRMANIVGVTVMVVATTLGLTAIARAASTALGFTLPEADVLLPCFAAVGLVLGLLAIRGTPLDSAKDQPAPAS